MRRFFLSCLVTLSLIGCGQQKAIQANAKPATSTDFGREVVKSGDDLVMPSDLPSETPESENSSVMKSRYWQINHGTTMVGFFLCPGYGNRVFQLRSDFRIDSTYSNYGASYQMAWFQISIQKNSTWKWCYPFSSVQYVYF